MKINSKQALCFLGLYSLNILIHSQSITVRITKQLEFIDQALTHENILEKICNQISTSIFCS